MENPLTANERQRRSSGSRDVIANTVKEQWVRIASENTRRQ